MDHRYAGQVRAPYRHALAGALSRWINSRNINSALATAIAPRLTTSHYLISQRCSASPRVAFAPDNADASFRDTRRTDGKRNE